MAELLDGYYKAENHFYKIVKVVYFYEIIFLYFFLFK